MGAQVRRGRAAFVRQGLLMPADSWSLKRGPRWGCCVVFVFSGGAQGRGPDPTSTSLAGAGASLWGGEGEELGGLSG